MQKDCPLNARELEVVRLLAKGKSVKIIAFELGVSMNTVYWRVRTARGLVGMRKDTGLVGVAYREGWIA